MGLEFRGLRLGYNIGLRVRGRWFMASGSGFRVSWFRDVWGYRL